MARRSRGPGADRSVAPLRLAALAALVLALGLGVGLPAGAAAQTFEVEAVLPIRERTPELEAAFAAQAERLQYLNQWKRKGCVAETRLGWVEVLERTGGCHSGRGPSWPPTRTRTGGGSTGS